MRIAALVLLSLVPACAANPPGAAPRLPSLSWRDKATQDDQARLRDWRSAFKDALAAAVRSGHGSDIAREGSLLEPDAALGGGAIPNGDYRCRTIKLGAQSQGMLDYVAYPVFRCRASPAEGVQSFAKLSGSQRLFGRIYPGDALRQVFLGTLVLGDETQAMRYGSDRDRNVAAYLERISPSRWRLVMPSPHFESQLDIMELVPAS